MGSFEQAAGLLPLRLRRAALELPEGIRRRAEELRLRAGAPPGVTLGAEEIALPGAPAVEVDDLYTVLELASQHSAHTVLERMREGFVTVRGGHRVGLCGEAALERGAVTTFRRPSSLDIRIARAVRGAAREVLPELLEGGRLLDTLIVAPPGVGKTTFLRDLIRCVSDGDGVAAMRVGVADERGELAALWEGVPQLEMGRRTDVLDGVPKAEGLLMLLRGMAPQVLAVDEITHPRDVDAVAQAAGCGVTLLATAHGSGLEGLARRPVYRALLEERIFRRAVCIRRTETGERIVEVESAC